MKKCLILLTIAGFLLSTVGVFAASNARFSTERWTHPSATENRSFYSVTTPNQGSSWSLSNNRPVTVYKPITGFKEITLNPEDDGGVCSRSWSIYDQNGAKIYEGDGNWGNGYVEIFDGNYLNTDRQFRIYANAPYTAVYVRFKNNDGFCCWDTYNSVMKVTVKSPGAKAGGTIVFLHGFLGFGRNEAGGANKYWGLLGNNDADHHYRDLQDGLQRRGYSLRTGVVGPVGSNHDRACELYAQLMNQSVVYYGEAHSSGFDHKSTVAVTTDNFNMDNWVSGVTKPVHIISHSMGGQTARRLVELLNKTGDCAGENPASIFCYKENINAAGASSLVASVTTISTPNNGTTLVWGVDQVSIDVFKQTADELYDDIMWLYDNWVANDGYQFIKGLYNLKMDQWALHYNGTPWTEDQRKAVMNGTTDISKYDLSPIGATAQNAVDSEDPNVYYFSWVTARGAGDDGAWCTKANMSTPSILGCLANFAINPGEWVVPAQWANIDGANTYWGHHDGVVNVWSQAGPKSGRTPVINYVRFADYASSFNKGQWYCLGFLYEDHGSIIGLGCPETGIQDVDMTAQDEKAGNKGIAGNLRIVDWYQNLVDMLRSLN